MTVEALAVGPAGVGAYSVTFGQAGPLFEACSGRPRHLVCPGLVDVHIHGGFGIDLMSARRDEASLLADRLAEVGYEAALATTVSCGAAEALRLFDSVSDVPLFTGVHLEGPFLSPSFPGAQPPGAIELADPSDPAWKPVLEHPRLRLVTLAPEVHGAAALAEALSSRGVTVSAGHTGATYEQARIPGLSHVTHCYNAMRPLHHREPGVLGAALTSDEWSVELIYDRVHVSRVAADVLQRCKPPGKIVAVSDGTMASGLAEGSRVTMWGLDCIVHADSVRTVARGNLAGSACTLLDVFRNLHDDFGPELAVRSCCLNPRAVAGLSAEPRVWLVLDQGLQIVERWEAA